MTPAIFGAVFESMGAPDEPRDRHSVPDCAIVTLRVPASEIDNLRNAARFLCGPIKVTFCDADGATR